MKDSTPTADLDIDAIEDLTSAEYELRHPVTGEPTGAFITIAGPEHPERKRIRQALINRARAAAMAANGQPQPYDAEKEFKESCDLLVRITQGWRGIRKDGKPLEFSAQAAQELYSDPKRQWIARQLNEAMNRQELFIKA